MSTLQTLLTRIGRSVACLVSERAGGGAIVPCSTSGGHQVCRPSMEELHDSMSIGTGSIEVRQAMSHYLGIMWCSVPYISPYKVTRL